METKAGIERKKELFFFFFWELAQGTSERKQEGVDIGGEMKIDVTTEMIRLRNGKLGRLGWLCVCVCVCGL